MWRTTFLDTDRTITRAYVPTDLVDPTGPALPGVGQVRRSVAADLRAMARAARDAGASEHQLATAVDLRSAGSTRAPWDYADWGTTAAGTWLRLNAHRNGFVMSYPSGGSAESCSIYEPWHFRSFGRALAARIHDSGLLPRRYLWTHHETAR